MYKWLQYWLSSGTRVESAELAYVYFWRILLNGIRVLEGVQK